MKPLRVLIIDDSAFARKVIREVLSRDPGIEVVGIARDGLEGLEKISELKPDVATLDLIMPDLDGIGVLTALQNIWSPKIVVVSISGSETELALHALELGAVELVAKPTPLASDRLYELSAELLTAVKNAGAAKIRRATGPAASNVTVAPVLPAQPSRASLLAIGTSTGGPQALSELFKTLPGGLPFPIVIALHIPAGYTAPLAARISAASVVQLTEAQDGMELENGRAYIAPGGWHLSVTKIQEKYFARVSIEPMQTPHHPSVDVLLGSAAQAAGTGAVGVVLTGMGSDGLAGAADIRKAGGRVLAESESSCVVYGMPRSIIEAGLASAQAPLERMVRLILDQAFSTSFGAEVPPAP